MAGKFTLTYKIPHSALLGRKGRTGLWALSMCVQLFSLFSENCERETKSTFPLYQKAKFHPPPTPPQDREFCWRKRAERIKILAELNAINLINLPCDTLNKKVKGQSLACKVTFHLQRRPSQWGPELPFTATCCFPQ